MKVSLNWIRDYVELPEDLSAEQLAFDVTMRTVEVESVTNPADLVEGIVVGRIVDVKQHPKADKLHICLVECGLEEPKQIVCGGSNLYVGEIVAVALPGSMVRWHGEGEPVRIKEAKLRGERSYGMICSASEINLDELFPADDERIILDLKNFPDAKPGEPLADLLELDDVILEIDNKSMTNRPDLWGHYGIAREMAAIYGAPLKPLPTFTLPDGMDAYPVEIVDTEGCRRYDAVVYENVSPEPAPFWMQRRIWSVGMRPINALVDVTNYVMLAVGQPTHGFDADHVEEGIRVRTANPGEKLELLDKTMLELASSDLLICDGRDKPIGLAGIMGGSRDSVLPGTRELVLEVANFNARTIRRTANRLGVRTESSNRFEKALDTQRCDEALGLAQDLIASIQPQAKIKAAGCVRTQPTEQPAITVPMSFIRTRSGLEINTPDAVKRLQDLGFDVEVQADDVLHVVVPTWRATGDVSLADDILEEVARMTGYENFTFTPTTIELTSYVRQPKADLNRALREFLACSAGVQEIYTYPWISDRMIRAAGADPANLLTLAAPPAPDHAHLRDSLVPGLIEATAKNLRYFDAFGIFELTQVFTRGNVSSGSGGETLPLQTNKLGIALTGEDPVLLFRNLKGILEMMPRSCHFEPWTFDQVEKAAWADAQVWLNLIDSAGSVLGHLALLSVKAMAEADIENSFVAICELNVDKLEPLDSRDNAYEALPSYPLVEQDLSILVADDVNWATIKATIADAVRRCAFIEEYHGKQVPAGKKSVMFRFWIGSDEGTLTAEAIETRRKKVIRLLAEKVGAQIR